MDTRDSLYAGLQRMGVKVKLPRSFRPEQCIGAGKSLGIIEADLGAVRWINVRKLNENGADVYVADFAVPDMRLHKFPELEELAIHCAHEKSPAVRWQGDDLNLGILEQLNRDPHLQSELPPAKKSHPDVFGEWSDEQGLQIHAHPDQRCWTLSIPIETKLPVVLGIFGGRRLRVPTASEIEAFQQIGRILLNVRLMAQWELTSASA